MDAVLLIFGDIDFMEFELVKLMLPELNKGLIILLSAVMVLQEDL